MNRFRSFASLFVFEVWEKFYLGKILSAANLIEKLDFLLPGRKKKLIKVREKRSDSTLSGQIKFCPLDSGLRIQNCGQQLGKLDLARRENSFAVEFVSELIDTSNFPPVKSRTFARLEPRKWPAQPTRKPREINRIPDSHARIQMSDMQLRPLTH